MSAPSEGAVVVDVVSPASADGKTALRAYLEYVAGRHLGRPATQAEVDDLLRADPSDDLASPAGVLLAARRRGSVVGCAGLRLLPGGIGEVKRLFVAPAARGQGLGRRLMREVERHARNHGLTVLRLDTRSDLTEARALYATLGYEEVPAFNAGMYAEHWYAKRLG